jgi:hypothetical protein
MSQSNVVHSLGELIDRLTIDQIKQFKRQECIQSLVEEIGYIEDDLDDIFLSKDFALDIDTLRLIISLAQINLHIWSIKEEMIKSNDFFSESMKIAHQINGIRNKLKNRLSILEVGSNGPMPSNTSTEDLNGWRFSILEDQG